MVVAATVVAVGGQRFVHPMHDLMNDPMPWMFQGGGIGGGFGVAEEGTSDARPGTRHNAKPDQNAQTDEFVNAGNTPDNGANEQPEPKRSRHDVLVLEPFVQMPMVHPHAPSAEQSVVTDDPTTNGGGIAPLVLPREHFCIPARVSAAVVEASCQTEPEEYLLEDLIEARNTLEHALSNERRLDGERLVTFYEIAIMQAISMLN